MPDISGQSDSTKGKHVNNRILAIALGSIGALMAISLVVRFVLLSEYGLSGGWMFFGLPFGGIGIVLLLLRLGVFGAAQRTGGAMVPWQTNFGVAPPPVMPFAPNVAVSQRLHELDGLRSSGAISETEYTAKRQQLITGM
jgi:hypothetical protein